MIKLFFIIYFIFFNIFFLYGKPIENFKKCSSEEIEKSIDKDECILKHQRDKKHFEQKFLRKLNKDLGLADKQTKEIEMILQDNLGNMITTKLEFKIEMDKIKQETDELIIKLLDKEQIEIFNKNRNAHKKRPPKISFFRRNSNKKDKNDLNKKLEFRHEEFIEVLKKDLSLSEIQVENIDRILKDNWEKLNFVKENFKKKMEKIKENVDEKIEDVLSPEQVKEFKKICIKRDKMCQ
jgi:hypothetical protein